MDVAAQRTVRALPTPPSGGYDRVPPHNLDAEISVIGSMLLSKNAIAEVTELVTAQDFYRGAHRTMFEAIQDLYDRGEPVDAVTLADDLQKRGALEDVGGPLGIADILAKVPTSANALHYARIVAEHAIRRRLIETGTQITRIGYDDTEGIDEAVDTAEQLVYNVAQLGRVSEFTPMKQLLTEGFAIIEKLHENNSAITGLATGFTDLDELTSGLQPSNLVILAARPAMGKCLRGSSRVIDPMTGSRATIAQLVARGRAGEPVHVAALDGDLQLRPAAVAAFHDNGVQPLFRLRTRLGREVVATASHPLLTRDGWQPLAALRPGQPIAAPRALPYFGTRVLPDAEVVALASRLGAAPSGGAPAVRAALGGAGFARTPAGGGAAEVRTALGGDPAPLGAPEGTSPTAPPAGRSAVPCTAAVPDEIFTAPREQVALFLRVLCDDAGVLLDGAEAHVRLPLASEQAARDVQHLLLRFGIAASLEAEGRPGWDGGPLPAELVVRDPACLRTVTAAIGVGPGRPPAAGSAPPLAGPPEALRAHESEGREHDGVRAGGRVLATAGGGGPAQPQWRVAVDDAVPPAGWLGGPGGAERPSDVRWDEVVTIEPAGEERVYDLTVPGDHNFVADDLVVHNSTLVTNIAVNVAVEQRKPAVLFSLEMSQMELVQRIMAAEARVDSDRLRTGRLQESDWPKLSQAMGRLAEAPLFIDDTPGINMMEIRSKCRRLKQKHGLELIIVDYLQLMQSHRRFENRVQEVSELSRGLKILAKELEVPVVALSQLSRRPEERTDRRPQLADLRESGCLPAHARVLRADTGAEVTMGELHASGERDIPVWSVDHDYRVVRATMSHVFSTGIKDVFRLRLASGRTIEASANHPFLTYAGWTRLDELEVGSRLAVPRWVPEPGTTAVMGDDEVVALADLSGTAAQGAPREVFSLKDPQLALYLRRLWTSGGHPGRPGQGAAGLTSGSRGLVDDLQLLLLRFGVASHVRMVEEGEDQRYELQLSGPAAHRRLLDEIGGTQQGQVTPDLRTAPDDVDTPADLDTVPAAVWGLVRARLGEAGMSAQSLAEAMGGPWAAGVPFDRPVPRRQLLRAAELLDDEGLRLLATSDLGWDEVVAIERLGRQEVFDATVAGTHNFIANNVVVENSIEQDADIVAFIYRDEVYNPDSAAKGEAELIVAKHRAGPLKTVHLAFLGPTSRFANLRRGPGASPGGGMPPGPPPGVPL